PAPQPMPQQAPTVQYIPQQPPAQHLIAPQPLPPIQPQPVAPPVPDMQQRLSAIQKAGWEELKALCGNCNVCSFGAICGRRLFAAGAPSARLLFVGDYPTQEEDETGTPFAGNAGIMLYKMGKAMGFSWESTDRNQAVAVVNLFKCRPRSAPTEQHIQACLPILQRQIELIAPDALVLLGALPTKVLTGKTGFNALKGTLQSYNNRPAMVIQSPSVILRYANNPEAFANERRQAWNSLQELIKILQK
ncbi:MAG: uracil-DNA glycosylase, partial [Victivallales bacterium]|nr:uracil-DNA glycosylase [Victivallales bacterium]